MDKKIRTMLVAWLAAILVISVFGTMITTGTTSESYLENDGEGMEPPVENGEMFRNRTENAAANGAVTFLRVEDYEPWAALVINAGDPEGVDEVTISFEANTLIIEATDSNHTNHVSILINRAFADEYLAESESDIEMELSDAVNYNGTEDSNASAGGNGVYVFHIGHFSTQSIELSSPPFDPPVGDGEVISNRAQNAARHGVATFLEVEGYEPWAALVINAGDPQGVDAVTVSFEDETLIIEAEDNNNTNHVTILMNKQFADEHLAESEDDLDIETSDAVNYDGLDDSNASAGGRAMYVFHIDHFSTQTIEVSAADSLPFLGVPMLLVAMAVPVAIYALKKEKQ